MQLVDVMRRLNTEHEIRFLLTAYLETLRSRDASDRLLPRVAALPLRDAQDIQARFSELLNAQWCAHARSPGDTPDFIEREATEIFGAAVTRLHTLHARTDASPPVHGIAEPVPGAAHTLKPLAIFF